MAVQVLPKDLANLLSVLRDQLPRSISVYMPVSLITCGLTGYDVYVDRWPEFGAVVVKTREESLNDPDHEKVTCIYNLEDTEDTVLRDLLGESGLFSQPVIVVPGTWLKTSKMISDILCSSTEPSFVEHLNRTVPVYCCTTVSKLPELPTGYSARCLRHKDYETILTGVWYKDFDYVKSVKRVLALGALSVGVEDSSGQLVAWTLQHISGMLGMTFVIPEHRNKKLGKYVTVALTQKMIAQDGFCLAGIEEGNLVSEALHEGVGFTKLDQPLHFGIYYENGSDVNIQHLKMPSQTEKNWK